ncbi:MAG: C13 family peptidase [Alphaproteobacteria bacterium]
MRNALRITCLLLVVCFGATPAFAGPFGAWVGIVVAGDNTADGGAPSEVFDNARRDIARHLINIGFESANVRQFSIQPGRYPEAPLKADYQTINQTVTDLTRTARGGCFIYFTSHGLPQGMVVDGGLFTPQAFAEFVNGVCADVPSVIIVSACYSGVFIPALATDSRMILTAARPDRPSFGCGADFTYTYFDQCVLEMFPNAQTFPELATEVQSCVAAREEVEGAAPPSEPQLYVGGRAASLLEFYTLDPG